MPDQAPPRWTEEAERVLMDASNDHIAISVGPTAYRCSCGRLFETPPGSGIDELERIRLHQFRASLAALSDAGLLAVPEIDCIQWGERIEGDDNAVHVIAHSDYSTDPAWRPMRRDPGRVLVRRQMRTYPPTYTQWAEVVDGERR